MVDKGNLQMSTQDLCSKAPKIFEQCHGEKGSNSRLREQFEEHFSTCDDGNYYNDRNIIDIIVLIYFSWSRSTMSLCLYSS